MDENKLYMPQGLNTNKEFMKGLENKAIITMFIIIIILNIPNIILSLFFIKAVQFPVFYLTISVMIGYMLVVKDSSNISVLDILGFFIKFISTQKKYEYILKDEWGLNR